MYACPECGSIHISIQAQTWIEINDGERIGFSDDVEEAVIDQDGAAVCLSCEHIGETLEFSAGV